MFEYLAGLPGIDSAGDPRTYSQHRIGHRVDGGEVVRESYPGTVL